MSELALRVEQLSKRYRLGEMSGGRFRYKALRDTLADAVAAPVRRLRAAFNPAAAPPARQENTLWALREVSFDITHGEVVGIIGRNGAGKSTLLKILSRITEPTDGFAEIHGRIGSLLEVGTGFHPELTGRENIFLNGAILGMHKAEITRKFDEIVAFAEIEKFLDTPVKRYSSGMYVRLAFAVAAHLEPEILLVDEVLAVGDAAFQKKCMGKMDSVAKSEGRTVFFVSHNIPAVTQLCTDCLWLDRGTLVERGKPGAVVLNYLTSCQTELSDGTITAEMHYHRPLELCFTAARLLNRHGEFTAQLPFGSPLRIRAEFTVREPIPAARIGLAVMKMDGTLVATMHHTDDARYNLLAFQPGTYQLDTTVHLPLMPGNYYLGLLAKPDTGFWGSGERSIDFVERALAFHVDEVTEEGEAVLASGALVHPASQWTFDGVPTPS